MKNGTPHRVIADIRKGKPVSRIRAEHAIRFCASIIERWQLLRVQPELIHTYAQDARFIAEKCCVR